MPIVPTFSSPCDLSIRIPDMVASFFQLDIGLGKRFREESATDVIVASLLQLGSAEVAVIMPNEKFSGSDFDITVVNEFNYQAVQFRIQAKRLTAHLGDWTKSSYKELAHPHGSGGQATTLIRSSAHESIPTIPLYAFYNPTWVCDKSNGQISGLELASGVAINRIVKDLVKAKPKRPPSKRIANLRHLFFPFSTILCPAGSSSVSSVRISSPVVLRASVEATIRERFEAHDRYAGQYAEELAIAPPEAGIFQEEEEASSSSSATYSLPVVVRRALETRRSQPVMRGAVKRPKVILISTEK